MVYSWCTLFEVAVDEAAWVDEIDSAWTGWADLADIGAQDEGSCPEDAPLEWFVVRVTDAEPADWHGAGVVFGGDVPWGFGEEIADPTCANLLSIRTAGAHAIGHFLGLGHTCDEGETCTDPAAQTAIMFWSLPACTERVPNEADLALLEPPDDGALPEGVTAPGEAGARTSGCSTRARPAPGAFVMALVACLARRVRDPNG